MTAWPRALCGPVMNMARPRRPSTEAQLVREAAAVVRAETRLTSAKGQSREVARRVVIELMKEVEADELSALMAAIEHRLSGSPFQRLASCPNIDTASLFVELQVERVRARSGRYLSPEAQAAERRALMREVEAALSGRYDRHLRGDRHRQGNESFLTHLKTIHNCDSVKKWLKTAINPTSSAVISLL